MELLGYESEVVAVVTLFYHERGADWLSAPPWTSKKYSAKI